MSQEDVPGLPFAPADAWLRQTLPHLLDGAPWSASVISGGLSNITYRLRTAGGGLVLRRPPLAGALPSAHDMRREYRVLSGLKNSAVPVPTTVALCEDDTVLGAPFYVMAESPGVVLRTAEDTAKLTESQRQALGTALVDTLAALHAIDANAVGLGDFGRPAGYLARQVSRWGDQWQRSHTRDLPDMEHLLARMRDELPPDDSQRSAIVHGDYRLDNTLVDLTGDTPSVSAVLDWELSTLGDPMADLGLALAYWHDADDTERWQIPVAAGVTAHPGFPTSRAFAAAYAERTGADLSRLPYYLAFGCMKLAIILEGVHARHLGGKTVGEGYERAGDSVPLLVARALHHLGS